MPVSVPATLEIGSYYFVNSMVTLSAVIFLFAPNLRLAAAAGLNMDDAGQVAAAAKSLLIVGISLGVCMLYRPATIGLRRRAAPGAGERPESRQQPRDNAR